MDFRPIAATLLLLAALPAAAVSFPDQGITVDSGRDVQSVARTVRHPVDVDRLRFAAMAKDARIALPSTDGEALNAAFSRLVDHGGGRRSWIGKVSTPAGEQSVVLTFDEQGVAFGWLPQRRGLPLRLETRDGGAWLVEGAPTPGDLAGDVRLPDVDGPAPKSAAGPVPKVSVPGLGDVPRVDVLVAYTPEMVTVWGSDDAVLTRLAFLESLSNQVYVDSHAGVQIRIVRSERVDHSLPYSNDGTLDVITESSTHPAKLQVDAARTASGADLVVLVTSADYSRGSCGVAWLLGKPAFDRRSAFAVVNDHSTYGDADCWEITFPHEVGHLMGSHHDDATSEGEYGAYVYSRGHRGDVPGRRGFATVMAYPAEGQDYVALLSNPGLDCYGQPCGIADFADNARSHTTAAPSVAAMLAAVLPVPDAGLSITDARLVEQHEGTRQMRFRITRGGDDGAAVSFIVQALPETATAGSDYIAPGRERHTIAAGQVSTTIDIPIIGDRVPEKQETFSLVIVDPEGAVAFDAVGSATIDDDDPGVYIDDATIVEGPTGLRQALLTARVTQGAPGPVTLRVRSRSTHAETEEYPTDAVAGIDYVAIDRTVKIPDGETSKQFSIELIGDKRVEQDETFTVVVEPLVNAAVFAPEATVRIADDDLGISYYESSRSVVEGTGGQTPVTITVQRYPYFDGAVTIGYVIESDTGTAGDDVGPVQGTFVHSGTSALAQFTVNVTADAIDEPHERVRIRLVSDEYDVPDHPMVLNIADDDGGAPMLSIDDVETVEGSHYDTAYAWFTVGTSAATNGQISFDTVLVAETAGAEDVVYFNGSHVLQPGDTSVPIGVQIQSDEDVEADETYRIELRNVVGAGVADGSGTGTIRDDDHGWPVAYVAQAQVVEGAPGQTTKLRLQLQLDRPALAGTRGRIVISGGDAGEEGQYAEYVATPGVDLAASVPFPAIAAGKTSAWIDVPVFGDGDIENDEGFVVGFADMVNLEMEQDSTSGTIRNDDHPWHEISEIQGRGAHSPYAGRNVSTQGVVTAVGDFGVVIQQEGDGDGDPATSDAIAVGVNDSDDIRPGDLLRVGGPVYDWSGDPNAVTSISGEVQRIDRGRALPKPVELDDASLHPALPAAKLEHYEWMRVFVRDAVVVAPGGLRSGLEWMPDYQDGSFHVVAAGVPRPRRDAGLAPDALTPLPAGVDPARWDGSFETLWVDPYPQRGGGARPVDAGDTIANLRGILQPHHTGTWRLALDPGAPAAISGATPTTSSTASPGEVRIAWLDAAALFDAVDDEGSDPQWITAEEYALRLGKLARLACGVLRHPDVLVVDGIEHATVLADLAEALNEAATFQPGECDASPGYVGVMAPLRMETAGYPQLGVLVRRDAVAPGVARVEAAAATEIGRDSRFDEPFFDPLLFERPPLVVPLVVHATDGGELALTLVAVSMRDASKSASIAPGNGWEDEGTGVRAHRVAQAIEVANWIQARQASAPAEQLLVLGDFQAIDGGDGLVDTLGIVRGGALPKAKVVTWRASPVARPLVDLGAGMHAADRWETVLGDGSTVALAHALASAPLATAPGLLARIEYPRVDADFAVDHAADPALALRAARRDPLLVRLEDSAGDAADLHVWPEGGAIDGGNRRGRRLVVHLDNLGPATAQRPKLVVTVGAAPDHFKSMPPPGWTCSWKATTDGTRGTCDSGRPLPVGNGPVFLLDFTAAPAPVVTVRLRASSATADPDAGNDVANTGG